MIRVIREKVGNSAGEERRATTILFCQDDLIKEPDGGIMSRLGFSLVDEFVKH